MQRRQRKTKDHNSYHRGHKQPTLSEQLCTGLKIQKANMNNYLKDLHCAANQPKVTTLVAVVEAVGICLFIFLLLALFPQYLLSLLVFFICLWQLFCSLLCTFWFYVQTFNLMFLAFGPRSWSWCMMQNYESKCLGVPRGEKMPLMLLKVWF